MEFEASEYVVTIEENFMFIKKKSFPVRRANLFYIVLFLWFIYLFLIRFFKLQTTLAIDIFMVLLLAAVIVYYLVAIIIWYFRGLRKDKIAIREISSAEVVLKDGNYLAAWQTTGKKVTALNFKNDSKTANALITAIKKINGKQSE